VNIKRNEGISTDSVIRISIMSMSVSVKTEKSGKRYVVLLSTKRRRIKFPARCWLTLVQMFGEINEAIDSKQCYRERLGAEWIVSVHPKDATVHLHRFYYRFGTTCTHRESRDRIDLNQAEFLQLTKTPRMFNVLPYVKEIHSEMNACCFTPY